MRFEVWWTSGLLLYAGEGGGGGGRAQVAQGRASSQVEATALLPAVLWILTSIADPIANLF